MSLWKFVRHVLGCAAAWGVAGGAQVALACPMCAETVNSAGSDVTNAYQASILFMMSMPFLIFGGFAVLVYRSIQKHNASNAEFFNEDEEIPVERSTVLSGR